MIVRLLIFFSIYLFIYFLILPIFEIALLKYSHGGKQYTAQLLTFTHLVTKY